MVDIINPSIVGTFALPSIITANRVFNFDADLGITTDGDGVTNWADQDANVGDLFAESALRSPDLITNGNPAGDGDAIEFSGSQERMIVVGGFTWLDPATVYLVMKQITWVINRTFFDGGTTDSMLCRQSDVTPKIRLFSGTLAPTNDNMPVDTWVILCAIFNGASSSLRINNTAKIVGDPQTADPGGFNVGSNLAAVAESNIRVARILGYDTAAHTDAEQDQNITALNNIYSVF